MLLNRFTVGMMATLALHCGQNDGSLTQTPSSDSRHARDKSNYAEAITVEDFSESADEKQLQLLLTTGEGTCDEGVNAFKTSVHPLLRDRCVKCHDSEHNPQDPLGPTFAVADAAKSYSSLLAYQNFDDIANSNFVKKGGNMHCLNTYGYDCKTAAPEVAAAVQAWWDGGEKTCPRKGKFFTGQLPIPANLPDRSQGFLKMRWDLGNIGPLLRNSSFEMEAQLFASPADDNAGAYRFRKPRIVTPTRTIILKDVKILSNGRFNPLEDAFRPIDQTVAPGAVPTDASVPTPFPVLSSKAQIVLASGSQDQIMVSFEDLRNVTTAIQCKALDKFQSDVLPLLEFRNCYQCHSGGTTSLPGSLPANAQFAMNVPAADLCKAFIQRISRQSFEKSPIATYPALAVNGHPLIVAGMDEAAKGLKSWYTAEMAP